ncbi:ATP-binding protein [Microbacterium sp.]|uniref:ATP-binding protein n=1 Tax=Microbacterium sp. TaxID=51671 RepID=UPI00333FC5AB
MTRGRLRVLLGAAPGVGKTYEMLAEGHRLAAQGDDVVIAVVETHGRTATAAQAAGLERVPLRTVEHRGVPLSELDVEAVLARAPRVALVDELAHTNAPGSAHAKRWQDVEQLRDAGIDVITTVNVQHIESLGGVVEKITGIVQQETVPDAVVRAADDVEVVDLAPQSLRDRLSAGVVYPAERVDAALSNYFRLGNLTALRELALLWLADEVDSALRSYRTEHGIETPWQTRERVVVALTGGPEGETLLRRGARIAARSAGGELLAVHVSTQDGLRSETPGALAAQQRLVASLGGSYHQLVADDIPQALVEFAQGADATQLVIGVSRRGRIAAALTGPGIGAEVIRRSGDIDVHIVSHAAAGGRLRLPRMTGGALGWRRQVLGLVIALIGGPLLSWMLYTFHSPAAITSEVLAYQLLVVVVALVGGIRPALFAAVLSGVTLDYLFVEPLYTVTIADPLHALALVLYVVIAVLVSIVVDQAARRARAAQRASAEAELLATVAGNVLRGDSAPLALVTRTREAFGLSGVRLVARDGSVIATDGEPLPDDPEIVPVGTTATLELHGGSLDGPARRLLDAIVAQLAAAIEHAELAAAARHADVLAETDRVRSALLSALSHDLRRPLAAAMAAVGGLRQASAPSPAGALSDSDRSELLETADESLATLSRLVGDLLDVSRVEAGVLAVSLAPVDAAGAVLSALDELGLGPAEVELSLDADLPPVQADAVLLQRVLVNVVANAHRHAPDDERVLVTTSRLGTMAEIRVIDRGAGVPPERQQTMFAPFQRQGDSDNTVGLGLGLALSRGFAEGMGGSLTPEDTPGGGLTMVIALPVASAGETDA